MKTPTPMITVGWNEVADLPDWSVYDLPVKIDTGARSSSLHVEDLERLPDDLVRFVVECPRRGIRTTVCTTVVRIARVTSSNGKRSKRIFVRTRLQLGDCCREIEVNLVDRGDMNYPMLVGRSALKGVYLVNPGKRRLTRRLKKKTTTKRP